MADDAAQPIDESRATDLAQQAVDRAGGARMVYRNPRQPFSLHSTRVFEIEGTPVEIRWGEISSPAVATVAGWVFEIHEDGIDLLIRPPRPRGA